MTRLTRDQLADGFRRTVHESPLKEQMIADGVDLDDGMAIMRWMEWHERHTDAVIKVKMEELKRFIAKTDLPELTEAFNALLKEAEAFQQELRVKNAAMKARHDFKADEE